MKNSKKTIKILAISDSHGNISALNKLQGEMQKADYIFHLGDHYYDVEKINLNFENKIYSVKGNCDGGGEEKIIEIFSLKIMLVHGDRYNVKSSLTRLFLRAQELKVDLVFFGHTHIPSIIEEEGIILINPGCLTEFSVNKTYCLVEIKDNKINAKIEKI